MGIILNPKRKEGILQATRRLALYDDKKDSLVNSYASQQMLQCMLLNDTTFR